MDQYKILTVYDDFSNELDIIFYMEKWIDNNSIYIKWNSINFVHKRGKIQFPQECASKRYKKGGSGNFKNDHTLLIFLWKCILEIRTLSGYKAKIKLRYKITLMNTNNYVNLLCVIMYW